MTDRTALKHVQKLRERVEAAGGLADEEAVSRAEAEARPRRADWLPEIRPRYTEVTPRSPEVGGGDPRRLRRRDGRLGPALPLRARRAAQPRPRRGCGGALARQDRRQGCARHPPRECHERPPEIARDAISRGCPPRARPAHPPLLSNPSPQPNHHHHHPPSDHPRPPPHARQAATPSGGSSGTARRRRGWRRGSSTRQGART